MSSIVFNVTCFDNFSSLPSTNSFWTVLLCARVIDLYYIKMRRVFVFTLHLPLYVYRLFFLTDITFKHKKLALSL